MNTQASLNYFGIKYNRIILELPYKLLTNLLLSTKLTNFLKSVNYLKMSY